jgi:hypothetical protein
LAHSLGLKQSRSRRWQTTTFVGAMRAGGLIAPLVVDGAMTGELFVAYVGRVLLPELSAGEPPAPAGHAGTPKLPGSLYETLSGGSYSPVPTLRG